MNLDYRCAWRQACDTQCSAPVQWLAHEELDPNNPAHVELLELRKLVEAGSGPAGQQVFRINTRDDASMNEPNHSATKRMPAPPIS